MADVKWIKMIVGMFDGMSFKKIKRAKIGGESYRDKLTAVWFELLDLAGRCNHNGALVETDGIPFTDLGDIADQIDRDEDELKLCMTFYLKERMVTIVSDAYTITNWCVFQNVDGMEKIREQTRQRVAKCREKKRLTDCNANCNATVTDGNALEEEKDIHSFILAKKANEENEFSTGLSTSVEAQRTVLGGELGQGVVMLSDDQINDLLDKLSLDEFNHYCRVVADCIKKGKLFTKKTHYDAILDMAIADRKVK